jgi:hypothetical protein
MMSIRQILKDDKGNVLYGRSEGDLEIFVDGIWGMTRSNTGTVKVNFYTRSMNTDGTEVLPEGEMRHVAFRMVTTVPEFIAIARYLMSRATEMEKDFAAPPEIQAILEQQKKERQANQSPNENSSKRKAASRGKRTKKAAEKS